jgi:hypothetical protein
VHYLLYLYDSLRLYLRQAPTPGLLPAVFRISQQKAAVRWGRFRAVLQSPNALILASLYGQPVPDTALFRHLAAAKRDHPELLTDANVLWLSLTVPKTVPDLERALRACVPPPDFALAKPAMAAADALVDLVLPHLQDAPRPADADGAGERPQTLDDVIAELGWVERDPPPRSRSPECALATGISPRLAAGAGRGRESGTGNLRHLMNPNQPTIVSRQIDGIPSTEEQIYQLANEVRMRQKLQGKTKAKLGAVKDEGVPEDDPETVLRDLVAIAYIDEHEARRIRLDVAGGRAPGQQRRARSEDTASSPPRRQAGPSSYFAGSFATRRGRMG